MWMIFANVGIDIFKKEEKRYKNLFDTIRKLFSITSFLWLCLTCVFFYVAGWFSVVSSNSGTGNARVYRRVGALVRAGVPAFLLAKPLRAYTLTHSKMGKLFYQ